MMGLIKDSDYSSDMGLHDFDVFASDLTYGDRTAFPWETFNEEQPNNWYSSLEVGQEANNTICLVGGEPWKSALARARSRSRDSLRRAHWPSKRLGCVKTYACSSSREPPR